MQLKQPNFSIILRDTNPLKGGTFPVVVRVTFDRKRRYYSLGLKATPEEWNNEFSRFQAKRLTEDQKKANKLLDHRQGSLKKLAEYFSEHEFSFDSFQAKMFGNVSGDVLRYFDDIIEALERDEKLGNARVYRNTRDKLSEFRKPGFVFIDIDKKFLQQFEQFISKTCGATTVSMYLRTLRAVYNRAIVDEIAKRDNYPFTGFSIKAIKTRKRALTNEQIEALKLYKGEGRVQESIDLFMFSYFARGMNLTDMANLKWSDVRTGRIFYTRQKTGDHLDMALDGNLAQILTKYANNEGYIFGILEDRLTAKTIRYRIHAKLKTINKDLQGLSSELGIPEDVTFYWARHSFATRLKRSGVAVGEISESLGHSSEAVTRNYLDSFETSRLDELSKFL